MLVTTRQLPDLISKCMEVDLVPFIKGDPAIGKSDIIRQVAKMYNLKVIDLRLSQADPTDLNGLPSYTEDKTKATFLPMDSFPIEGDELPKKVNGDEYDGWLLFLDELNSANLGVQAASFKLILDRMVGQHDLHSHVRIVAAGNKETSKGIVNRMSTPMQSRLAHFEVEVDNKQWLKWASENDIDYRITSFIKFKPEALYSFDPNSDKDTYQSPRTWEFCNRFVNPVKELDSTYIPLIAAVIGEAGSREFWTFCKLFKNLIKISDIIKDPLNIKMPEEQGTLYALSGSIGQHMTPANVEPLMKFVNRMHIEFQTLTLQTAICRDMRTGDKNNSLSMSAPVVKWVDHFASELY